jgi:hypothetical protein
LKPPPSPPFDHEPVDAGSQGLQCRVERRHHVEHREAGRFQLRRVAPGIAGGRRDEPHPLRDDEIDDARVAHEELRDVDPERLVGEVAHRADLVLDGVEFARRRLDDAEPPDVGDRRREPRARDPAHGGLDDGIANAQQPGDAGIDAIHGLT